MKPATAPSASPNGSSQSAWTVEHKGLEWVADSERHGKPRTLFWPWAAPQINVFVVSFGVYVAALAGQRGGAPTMVASRARGNHLPAALSYVQLVGWETVGVVLSMLAAKTVALRLNPQVNTTIVMVAALVVVTVVSTVVGAFGFRLIMLVQRWRWWRRFAG